MKLSDLEPKFLNQIILNFEDKGEVRYLVTDDVMIEIVELIGKYAGLEPVGAMKIHGASRPVRKGK